MFVLEEEEEVEEKNGLNGICYENHRQFDGFRLRIFGNNDDGCGCGSRISDSLIHAFTFHGVKLCR